MPKEKIPILRNIALSARDALVSPSTWIPAAASVLFYTSGLDETVSTWASENTPIYGSIERAGDASDAFRAASWWSYYCTAPFAYVIGGRTPGLCEVGLDIGAAIAAVTLTDMTTATVKTASHRCRPDRGDFRSFPSGHTSKAAVYATLASSNVDAMMLPRPMELAMHGVFGGMVAATAWGRIEGKHHYPSDVLAGAALGHFFGAFLTNILRGAGLPSEGNVQSSVSKNSVAIQLSLPITRTQTGR